MLEEKVYDEIIKNMEKHLDRAYGSQYGSPRFKCPFCGGSRRKPQVGHLIANKDKPIFYCFRCGETGSINWLFNQLGSPFRIKNTFNFKEKKSYIHFKNGNREYSINNKINVNILNYINDRVGLSNRLVGHIKKVIIPNVSNFINENNIEVKYGLKRALEENTFASFITFNKNKIICRNISKDATFNHITVNIGNNIDFFILFEKDLETLYNKETINVVVSEGVFDVFGFYRICEKEKVLDNVDIFIASRGSASISKSLLYIFIKFISKLNVTFLADHDTISKIKNKVYKNTRHVINSYEVLINEKDKDFGDVNKTGYKILRVGGKGCLF